MNVIGGINVKINQKQQLIKLARGGDYPTRLRWVAAQPIVFYDVSDQRAWLVDGASALLHLVRVSLHLDETDRRSSYEWVFAKLKEIGSNSAESSATLETLKDWDNLDLPIYVKNVSSRSGRRVREYATFGDRVNQILHWLEVLVDREIHLTSGGGIRIAQTLDRRKAISGFDTHDILRTLGPFGSRVKRFDSGADAIELVSSMGALTIFGSGFGNLIRPDQQNQTCTAWKAIPIGKEFLAVSVSTMRMIYEERLRKLYPTLTAGQMTDKLSWISSCHPFKRCGCLETGPTNTKEHINPVQHIVPSKPGRRPAGWSSVDVHSLEETGAVIFALQRRKIRANHAANPGMMLQATNSSTSQLSASSTSATPSATTSTTTSANTNPTNTTTTTSVTNTIDNVPSTTSSSGNPSPNAASGGVRRRSTIQKMKDKWGALRKQ
jgi:hypothetical protein